MNSEAQRLVEEAKRLTETRPCRRDAILCMFECEGCVKVREAHAIIDLLASLQSADQAREIEIRAERYELGRAVEARVARARAEALEEAANVCEGLRDLKERQRAGKAAAEALAAGDESEALHRLRHQSTVNLFNGALERAAREIRALASTEQAERNEGEKT